MARTPRSARITIDEQKLADLVKSKSDLSIRGQRKVWEKIAEELQAPVESVKKTWSKLQEEEAKLKMMELNKRRSLRSSSIDSTNNQQKTTEMRRRSLRSSSVDKSSLIAPSNENSCASSTCSSPKGEDKRSLRSRSQLSSITESELISMAAGDAAIMELPELKDQTQDPLQDQDLDDQTLVFEISNQDTEFSEIVSEAIERFHQDSELEKSLRTRFSEPVHNTKKTPQSNLNISPKQRPMMNKNNKMKRNLMANDSTRAFFDSMALTVASFPPHLQAQVKINICKIVGEIEYELSLPKVG